MRYFNTSGPNIPEKHYTIFREPLLEQGLQLVNDERYFTIWAPRQTGKSTFFALLAKRLQNEGFTVISISVERFRNVSLGEITHNFNRYFTKQTGKNFSGETLDSIFTKLEENNIDKYVWVIDEIENFNPLYFNDLLHSIRQLYHSRNQHALKSVILIGVSNILGIIQDNASPFNIADNLNVTYFTKNEVFELLHQHETETGQLFDITVKEKVFEITAGQPGLVNSFAHQLVEGSKNLATIGIEDFYKVEKWYLTNAIDKNVENIKNKANQYRKFVEQLLFSDKDIDFEIDKEYIKFLHVNGIIRSDENGKVVFWVPLYTKKLYKAFYPYTNGEKDDIIETVILTRFLNPDGTLNIDYLINKYKEYITKRSFRPYREKGADGKFVSIPEAAMIYSFETYIDAIISEAKGKIYREADAGLGKSDLIVNMLGKEYLFETKKYYSFSQFNDGKQQLAYYSKKLGLNEAVYLLFLSNKIEYPNEVKESVFTISDVLIHCYLVYYDIEKDF
jgi:hypothetical protein